MDPFFYFDEDEFETPEPVLLVAESEVISPTYTQDSVNMSAQNKVSCDK